MATIKRSKTMPADGQTTKFLYTILKQLDLKSIDWNLVASQLEITNGHAARMRFSRFRQHMEGNTTTARTPRAKKPKAETPKSKKAMFDEPARDMERSPTAGPGPTIKQEPEVKTEPGFEVGVSPQYFYPQGIASIPRSVETTPVQNPFYDFSTVSPADLAMTSFNPEPVMGYPTPPFGENWIQVKTEQTDGEAEMQDLYIKSEPNL
ncbi:hypothetical protein FQN49_007108 [Arthroderma sp. PD_2]|nr:hypothetical protein FQN49_007108 [Arthroderma sp. PD_2]